MSDPRQPAETPNKRRLSLFVNTDSSEKRAKTEAYDANQESDNDLPAAGTTPTRYHHQYASSHSSPTSSVTGEEREGEPELRPKSLGGFGRRTGGRGYESMANCLTLTAQRNEHDTYGQAYSSAHPTRPHQPAPLPPSGSTIASRHPSPPAFSLSSGQPLVNPPQKTQSGFVGKLFAILEDEKVAKSGLLYWSAGGTTFTCPNPTDFSREVLPRYYKHNNWQSFVRQLNMYSLSKVNEAYSTNADPTAWEFRHPNFRQGEAHLLASIKRKSSRPSTQEDSQCISPSDSLPDNARAVAGWMREPATGSVGALARSAPVSPQRLQLATQAYAGSGGAVPGNPPLSARTDDSRPPSHGGMWERRVPHQIQVQQPQPQPPPPRSHTQVQAPVQIQGMCPPDTQPQIQQQQQQQQQSTAALRYHPDSNRSYYSISRHPAETSVYPHPSQPPPMDALSGQVANLEDRLHRLAEMLNSDRLDHARSELNLTSSILHMLSWVAGDSPTGEMRAMQETLTRKNYELRQRNDSLAASNNFPSALALVSGSTDERRGRQRDATLPSVAQQSHSQGQNGRRPQDHSAYGYGSSGTISTIPSTEPTPRTSPRPGFSGSLHEHRSAHGNGSGAAMSNPSIPFRLGRSSNPNTNGATPTISRNYIQYTASVVRPEGPSVPYPSNSAAPLHGEVSSKVGQPESEAPTHPAVSTTEAERNGHDRDRARETSVPQKSPELEDRKSSSEERKAKAGLQDLLN